MGNELYGRDLAYIQAVGFGNLARGAAPAILQRLESAGISVRHVVDAGCGAGVLSTALTDAGYEVTGIDHSSHLLALAHEAAPSAQLVHASLYDAEIPPCEAVIALGEALTYHDDEADAQCLIHQFFRRAANSLPQGGLLMFDVIETGEPSLGGRFWTSGDDWVVMAETVEDSFTKRLVRTIETFRRTGQLYRRGREIHKVRVFEARVLEKQLREAGFEVETDRRYGNQPLGPRRIAFFATRL